MTLYWTPLGTYLFLLHVQYTIAQSGSEVIRAAERGSGGAGASGVRHGARRATGDGRAGAWQLHEN